MNIIKSTNAESDLLMRSRIEMVRAVNGLSEDAILDEEFIENTREYFKNACQTTVLAIDANEAVGCATICYIKVMPTFDHTAGKRAHMMNVYTRAGYRRQGIALKMMELLIEEARQKGVTEISLDATELGRPLYEKCGFTKTEDGMVLNLA